MPRYNAAKTIAARTSDMSDKMLNMRALARRTQFVRPDLAVTLNAAHTSLGIQPQRLFKG